MAPTSHPHCGWLLHRLDRVVNVFYDAASPDRAQANHVLMALQENVAAWQFVDTILDQSTNIGSTSLGWPLGDQLLATLRSI